MRIEKKIIVGIKSKFEQSAEARIFANEYLLLEGNLSSIQIIESADLLHNYEDNGQIALGFSSDQNFIEFCKKFKGVKLLSICDIYSVEDIVKNDLNYNGYIVPSDESRHILSFLTNKPIFKIEESADPLFTDTFYKINDDTEIKCCWFGFPESFNKSMTLFVNCIKDAIDSGSILSFTLITRPGQDLNSDNRFSIKNFDIGKINNILSEFGYCILSHAPLDLQLNTMIKSPNKLYSAVHSGLIPICSKTPAYERVMRKIGFSDYLFTSPESLKIILDKLKNNVDYDKMRLIKARSILINIYEEINIRNIQTLKEVINTNYKSKELIFNLKQLYNMKQSDGIRTSLNNLLIALTQRIYILFGILK